MILTCLLFLLLGALNISTPQTDQRNVNPQVLTRTPRKLDNNVTELQEIIVELEKNNLENNAKILQLENEIKSLKKRKFTIALHSVQVNQSGIDQFERKIVKTNWTRCPLTQSKSELLKLVLGSLASQIKGLQGKVKTSEDIIKSKDNQIKLLQAENQMAKANLTICLNVIKKRQEDDEAQAAANAECGGIVDLPKNSSKLLSYKLSHYHQNKLCLWTIKCFHGCSVLAQEIKFGKLILSAVEWENMDIPANHVLKVNESIRILHSWGYIVFNTNGSNPESGYRIKITPTSYNTSRVTGHSVFRYRNDTGSIFSHPINYGVKNYANNEMTTLVLSSTRTKHIVFRSLEFEPCGANCSCDYINFFSISQNGMKKIGERICSLPKEHLKFGSKILVLTFRSDSRNNGKGFSFLYAYAD